jgi:hypothetical protein
MGPSISAARQIGRPLNIMNPGSQILDLVEKETIDRVLGSFGPQ